MLICALLGATIWNLITWWLGPAVVVRRTRWSAACAAPRWPPRSNNWHALIWSQSGEHWWQGKGLLWKVILPMVQSPLVGFVLGFVLMGALFAR